ncbi:MAG: hypothetical protein KC445_03650 [Anaerolineales bacterium]|nr:hypothetical protein [Anaerolineales bacterium]
MHLKRLTLLILLLTLGGLAACAGDVLSEPTPIPPPPNADNGEAGAVSEAEATPLPTLLPEEETAVQPTPTLVPTKTPTTIAQPTAVTNPPVQVVNSQPLPANSRDLLFIADGSFKQWNHATGQIETLVAGTNTANPNPEIPGDLVPGSITAYTMNADGKRAVVARVLSRANAPDVQNAQTEYSYELLFVDMISREVWTLVPQVDNLFDFALSPNAQQLAFIGSGLDGIPDATSNDLPANNLYIMETGGGNPANLRQVHSCQTYCRGPEWHIENNLLAFGDDAALWLYNIAAAEPELVFENDPFTRDMSDVGQVSVYWPQTWARNGRSIMLQHGRWEGSSSAVLDLPTGTLTEVPNTFIYAEIFPSQVSWMPDDRILVWHTESTETSFVPFVELWRFDLGSGEMVLEESAQLSEAMLGVLGGTYLEDGRFAFALDAAPAENPDDAQNQIGTYQLTSLAETPDRVNSLPPSDGTYRQATVLWSADGSGALLTQSDQPNQPKLFFAPTDGEFLYEVTAVFGQNPHSFRWQPEIVVP